MNESLIAVKKLTHLLRKYRVSFIQGVRKIMLAGWPDVLKELLQFRGVQTLIGLMGRIIVVCGSAAIAVIATAQAGLDSTRLVVLAALGAGVLFLAILASVLGVACPDRLHFGANEWMRAREKEWEQQSSVTPLEREVTTDETVGPED